MFYMDAFKTFFKHKNWGMQLLLHSVCMLIPILGFIALFGHYVEVLVYQRQQDTETWPEFDFNRFGDYLGIGIWPFLTSLLVSLIAVPIMFVAFAPLLAIPAMELRDAALAAPVAAATILFIGMIFVAVLIQVPMYLASGLTQSVGAAFSWQLIRGFVGRVMGPIILMHLFLMGISFPLIIAGYLTCGLGLYPATAIILFTQWQLYRQVYALYLERGGTPIPFASKLSPPRPPSPELEGRPVEPASP